MLLVGDSVDLKRHSNIFCHDGAVSVSLNLYDPASAARFQRVVKDGGVVGDDGDGERPVDVVGAHDIRRLHIREGVGDLEEDFGVDGEGVLGGEVEVNVTDISRDEGLRDNGGRDLREAAGSEGDGGGGEPDGVRFGGCLVDGGGAVGEGGLEVGEGG